MQIILKTVINFLIIFTNFDLIVSNRMNPNKTNLNSKRYYLILLKIHFLLNSQKTLDFL